MVSMAHTLEGGTYLTIAEAVSYMGCTDSWLRHLIRTGKLKVRRLSERVQLIPVGEADRVKESLTTRSSGKRHLAERPRVARKPTKKAARRRK